MSSKRIIILTLVSLCIGTRADESTEKSEINNGSKFNQDTDWENATSLYQFHAIDIHGKNISFDKYKGNVTVVVNVASYSANTNENYPQLTQLYNKYSSSGLRILAFPCNQFYDAEPGTAAEILDFVYNYHIGYDLFQKTNVTGPTAHPLWKWLIKQPLNSNDFKPNEEITYDFIQFVLNKKGRVVHRSGVLDQVISLDSIVASQLRL